MGTTRIPWQSLLAALAVALLLSLPNWSTSEWRNYAITGVVADEALNQVFENVRPNVPRVAIVERAVPQPWVRMPTPIGKGEGSARRSPGVVTAAMVDSPDVAVGTLSVWSVASLVGIFLTGGFGFKLTSFSLNTLMLMAATSLVFLAVRTALRRRRAIH